MRIDGNVSTGLALVGIYLNRRSNLIRQHVSGAMRCLSVINVFEGFVREIVPMVVSDNLMGSGVGTP